MSGKDQYQVVGHCALGDTATDLGVSRVMLYRGAMLPGDVKAAQIAHLLDVNLIAKVPSAATGGVDATGAAVHGEGKQAVQTATGGAPGSTEDTEAAGKRAAAKAKLPTDGSAPDGRAGQDVWVEHAVVKGYSYDEASKLTKADLVELLKDKS
jgi:hypothetical protein